MEVKVTVTRDVLESATTNEISILCKDSFTFKGEKFERIFGKPILTNVSNAAVALMKSIGDISLHSTVSESNGETIAWAFLARTPKTEPVFEPFKKRGLYFSNFRFGFNFNTGTLYVSPKMCKDLGRMSEDTRAELYLYLYSLLKFMLYIQKNFKNLEVNLVSANTLDTNVGKDEFLNALPELSYKGTDLVAYIKEYSSEDLKSIVYSNIGLSRVICSYSPSTTVQVGIVEVEGAGYRGVCVTGIPGRYYTFVINNFSIFTDFDLNVLEMSPDSVCSSIARYIEANTAMMKVPSDKLVNGKYTVLSPEDVADVLEQIPVELKTWYASMLSDATNLEDEGLKHLKNIGFILGKGVQPIDCTAIKAMYDNDAYAQNLYSQIKPYYDKFDLKSLENNVIGFANGALYSMMFIGESGTGKSTAARVLPSRCGIPYVSVNFSVNIEEADLFGSLMPNSKRQSVEEPEFVWQDGIITKAVRNGYCVVLEEINFARPGVLGKLNSLLDENRQLDLLTGEIVKAHPNFRIIATCNIAYEGTNRFNKAFINRFDDVTMFLDLPRDEAIKVIQERTGYTQVDKIAQIYDVYEAVKKFTSEQRIHVVASMRQLLNLFAKGRYYKNAADAVKRILLNGAFIEEPEYLQTFEETVLPAFNLKFKL